MGFYSLLVLFFIMRFTRDYSSVNPTLIGVEFGLELTPNIKPFQVILTFTVGICDGFVVWTWMN